MERRMASGFPRMRAKTKSNGALWTVMKEMYLHWIV